jgi:UDP-N-acetylenolpyruvoylglucosamine reductase
MSPAVAEIARKNASAVLQALARHSQTRIAEQIGVNDSAISRFKDGDVERAAQILAACGLKVVPIDAVLYDRDKVSALLTLARDHLQLMVDPEQLAWK